MSAPKNLAFVGGGGFACEVLEVARLCGYQVSDYYANAPGRISLTHCGYLDELVSRRDHYDGVVLAFGALNQAGLRKRGEIADFLEENGFEMPVLVSPHAVVSEGVTLESGTFVAHGAVISVQASIGKHCLVNTSAVIGHHTVIGRNSIISPKVFIGGDCNIERDTVIGAGANILQGRTIGRESMVGVGADVYRDVKPNSTVWPARYQVTG